MSIICSVCKEKDYISYIKGNGDLLCPKCELKWRKKNAKEKEVASQRRKDINRQLC